MRIEQLEFIAAVTQHGSLRWASERLHISQPALSEAVTKLERELGVTLLDRRRSGTRISRRGRELQQHMVEVLEDIKNGAFAERFITDQDNGSPEFTEFRKVGESHPIESTGRELRKLFAWNKADDDYTDGSVAR